MPWVGADPTQGIILPWRYLKTLLNGVQLKDFTEILLIMLQILAVSAILTPIIIVIGACLFL